MGSFKESFYKTTSVLDKVLENIGKEIKEQEYKRIKEEAIKKYKYNPTKSVDENLANFYNLMGALNAQDAALFSNYSERALQQGILREQKNIAKNIENLLTYHNEEDRKKIEKVATDYTDKYGIDFRQGTVIPASPPPIDEGQKWKIQTIRNLESKSVKAHLESEGIDTSDLPDTTGWYTLVISYNKRTGQKEYTVFNQEDPSKKYYYTSSTSRVTHYDATPVTHYGIVDGKLVAFQVPYGRNPSDEFYRIYGGKHTEIEYLGKINPAQHPFNKDKNLENNINFNR